MPQWQPLMGECAASELSDVFDHSSSYASLPSLNVLRLDPSDGHIDKQSTIIIHTT